MNCPVCGRIDVAQIIRKLAPVEEVYVVFATRGQPAISTTTIDGAGEEDL